MESNYNIALNKGWDDLALKNPTTVIEKMKVFYKEGKFTVPYLGENYIVDTLNTNIYKEKDGNIPSIDDRILILHYLSFFETEDPVLITNRWVSLKEIPNGGALFYPAFHKTSIVGLIETFGKDIDLFMRCAKSLNGKACKFGDVGAVFEIFPLISLCAAIWEGEDDIPANATILYDPSIAQLLHIESIISLGMALAHKLIEISNQ